MGSQVLIAILGVTFIILLLIISMVIVMLVARKQSLSQQLKESVYQNKLTDISLASLRAQMNPHFIFNCLNSIKLYTEQNNSAAASEYLTKFSKLIRNTLENAKAESNLLSAEIETLRLYMDMEAMRIKGKMQYEINIDEAIDTEFIEIPPLLIQPYVENCIWHGLMHKESGGKLKVNITQDEAGEELTIIIEDDGIGRAKANLINAKNALKARSYGTQITEDRLVLINEKNAAAASVNIMDLFDQQGNAIGTRVTIKLSI